ncbi:hypothetical protein AXF42_Ash017839 [Apostasia shenzhenica]|uniref:Phosphorylated adapter RNA export protein n=1 Tax=Apostasia shenzhenica TaxID=1088818 RepID=A0A2I0A3X2_9ASPA|nr:hypothetical protein AXF42_Ash017839 [Apostasia shenzhenica]
MERMLECVQFGDEEELVEETHDDDVEMAEAESMDAESCLPAIEAVQIAGDAGGGDRKEVHGDANRGAKRKRNKKKRRKSGSASNITDINRFVIDTCRQLKEKKSYLIWTAVGCLGVSAVSDLVKEVWSSTGCRWDETTGHVVNAIQHCGGQRTADGKRYRTGGGILWNVLKTRDPKAYKEIMTKGKEFEGASRTVTPISQTDDHAGTDKQFRQPQKLQHPNKNNAVSPDRNSLEATTNGEPSSDASKTAPVAQKEHELSSSQNGGSSVKDRIRMPVSYDDLFEEGEIHE